MNQPLPPVADPQSWLTPRRISFLFMVVMLLLIGGLHMTTLLLTTLFSYFALRQFSGGRSKPIGIAIFTVVVIGMAYGLYFFSKQAYVAFPRITLDTIPAVVGFAEKTGD